MASSIVAARKKKRGVVETTPLLYGERPSTGRLRGACSCRRARVHPPRWFPLGPDTLRPASGPGPRACTWGCRRETAATPAHFGLASAADRSGNVPLSSETHDADFGL